MTTAAPAVAAEIELLNDHPEGCVACLSGKIATGDVEMVREVLPGSLAHGKYLVSSVLACMTSQSGGFVEGIALAEYFADAGIRIRVPAGGTCLSACAIAFPGRTRKGGEYGVISNRGQSMHATAVPGFHQPCPAIPDGDLPAPTCPKLSPLRSKQRHRSSGGWMSSDFPKIFPGVQAGAGEPP